MFIIYLTTAMRDEDFRLLSKLANKKPNPAGQNFHNKVIRAINTIDNISIVSIVPSYEHLVYEGNFEAKSPLDFLYFEPSKSRIHRLFSSPKEIANRVCADFDPKMTPNSIIVYDSLNITLAKASSLISHHLGIPRVAVLTDNPRNITDASGFYAHEVFKYSKYADGYFALSNGLIDLFNPRQINSLVTEGVAEVIPNSIPLYNHPYIYFGGALYQRYGIGNLIAAYNAERPNYDLLIAGHGPAEAQIKIEAKINSRIVYLGQISKQENYNYESHSSLNINPRPYNENLDRNSIPSKMIEFLSTNVPVLSTKATRLQTLFPDDVNWIGGNGSLIDIRKWFSMHLDNQGSFIYLNANNAKGKCLSMYGLEKTGQQLHALFQKILRS